LAGMASRRSGLLWTVLLSVLGLGTTALRYSLDQVFGDFVAGRITDALGAWTGVEEARVIAFVSCTRFLWTPICPRGDRNGEVQHERNRSS
jgi:hypothetical protein